MGRLLFFGIILLITFVIWIIKQSVGAVSESEQLRQTSFKDQTQNTMESTARGINWLNTQWEDAKKKATEPLVSDPDVFFTCKHLENCVREELNISSGSINAEALLLVTELDLSSSYITDISPLARMTNLTELNLSCNCELADISPLAGLTNLTELSLDSNRRSRCWGLIAAHRSMMVVIALPALHWQRVEPCLKFVTPWAIATSARPACICMPLMTARWDRSLSDAEG